jgi:hypothetical protein
MQKQKYSMIKGFQKGSCNLKTKTFKRVILAYYLGHSKLEHCSTMKGLFMVTSLTKINPTYPWHLASVL